MAQTNDEQLFRKVVSKPDFRNTFSNIEKKEILDNRSAPEAWHIKELMLQIAREARLATLDDCKTSLEGVLSRTIKTRSEFHITDINYIRLDSFAKGLEHALAELEALRNADDKK